MSEHDSFPIPKSSCNYELACPVNTLTTWLGNLYLKVKKKEIYFFFQHAFFQNAFHSLNMALQEVAFENFYLGQYGNG